MNLKTYTGEEVRLLRRKLGLNQSQFWEPFQTAQSGGSRYESVREIPGPVQVLLKVAFGTEAQATSIVGDPRALAKPPKKSR